MKKQNTSNNRFLRGVKKLMNEKIYKSTLKIVNTQGEEEAIVFLQQFFNKPIDFKTFIGQGNGLPSFIKHAEPKGASKTI